MSPYTTLVARTVEVLVLGHINLTLIIGCVRTPKSGKVGFGLRVGRSPENFYEENICQYFVGAQSPQQPDLVEIVKSIARKLRF